MKKIFFVLALGWLIQWPLQAQLQIGVTGSLHGKLILQQNNYGFSELEYKPVVGIGYGVFAGYQFAGKHSIQLEINRINLGQSYESSLSKGSVTNEVLKEVTLQYWQIPLVLNLGLNAPESANRFYLSAGLYYGILSSANIDWRIDGAEVTMASFHALQGRNPQIAEVLALLGNSEDPADYSDLFSQADYGVILGLGFRWRLSDHLGLITELRGGYGLADINNENWQIEYEGGYKNSANAFGGIRLGIAYGF